MAAEGQGARVAKGGRRTRHAGQIDAGQIEGTATAAREARGRGDWSDLARPGAEFALRITPGARRNTLTCAEGIYRCAVTAAPEEGRANAAVAEMLARALGVAKTRLTLVRGATARDKLFRLD